MPAPTMVTLLSTNDVTGETRERCQRQLLRSQPAFRAGYRAPGSRYALGACPYVSKGLQLLCEVRGEVQTTPRDPGCLVWRSDSRCPSTPDRCSSASPHQ